MRTLPAAWLLVVGLAGLLQACGVESAVARDGPADEAPDALGSEDPGPGPVGPTQGPDDHAYTGGPPSRGGSSAYPSGHPIGGGTNFPPPAHAFTPAEEWQWFVYRTNPELLHAIEGAEKLGKDLDYVRFADSYGGREARRIGMSPQRWRNICRFGCAVAAGASCAYVTGTCATGSFMTFGGISIPCIYIVTAACGASVGIVTTCDIKCGGG
jgi:hypothetical protein